VCCGAILDRRGGVLGFDVRKLPRRDVLNKYGRKFLWYGQRVLAAIRLRYSWVSPKLKPDAQLGNGPSLQFFWNLDNWKYGHAVIYMAWK